MMRDLLTVLTLASAVSGCAGGLHMPGGGTSASSDQTIQVAQAAYGVGDYDQAARLYEKAAAQSPKSVDALIGLGRSYAATGQYTRAQSALDAANTRVPHNVAVQVELGHLELQQMHPTEALGYYDAALQGDRRNLDALTGKGVSLDYLSRHAEAQVIYQQALAIYPTDFPLLSDYALSKVLSGNIGEGTRLMEELLRDPTKGPTVRANMALAYALDGREADARAMMQADVPPDEINRTLQYYRTVRKDYLAGKPIGYLVFR